MQKNNLLIIPFIIGLSLVLYSWYLSYPLSHHYSGDAIFDYISYFYWIGFSILISSIYVLSMSTKNRYLRWILTIASVITFYSLFYFYNTLSGSDSSFFRGLTENFINQKDLSTQFNAYYQWPAFFILADVTTLVSGISVISYEFLLISIIGVLLATSLFFYFSDIGNGKEILGVLAFFVLSFSFLNYQAAPFTVALCLLFLLLGLDLLKRSSAIVVLMFILFIGITILHAFVPLFFLGYLFLMLFTRSDKKTVLIFFVILLQIYLFVQILFGESAFATHIAQVFIIESDYSNIVSSTMTPIVNQIDVYAQLFSRIATFSFAALCFIGVAFAFFKKKLRRNDIGIFLTGLLYTFAGAVLYTLGTRAIPLIFIPVAIGIIFLYKRVFLVKYVLVFIVLLTIFIPMHSQYSGYPITYQTKDDLSMCDFLISHYDWASNKAIIMENALKWFISPQVRVSIDTNYDAEVGLGLDNYDLYDCIVYSVGLETSLAKNNISISQVTEDLIGNFNIVYNSGFSYIASK